MSVNTTARNLGFDEKSYESMVEAGKILLKNNPEPQTIAEYCEILKDSLSPEVYNFMLEQQDFLTEMINTTPTAKQDYITAETFRNLISKRGLDFFEGPRLVYLRVAVQLYMPNLDKIKSTYQDYMLGYYACSSPTLINGGYKRPMMSSCFVDQVQDSSEGVFDELLRVNKVVSCNASQGIDLSHIRHSKKSDGVETNGVIPVATLINQALRYSKSHRKPNSTIFLNVWHIDIEGFAQLNSPIGDQAERAYEVHTAIWTYDLFWKRVQQPGGKWTLFCPKYVPELLEATGDDFEQKYLRAESNPDIPAQYKKSVNARYLVESVIVPAIVRSGKPFVLNRDAATTKSNHRHLGAIGSNLCVEIYQHLDKNHFPTCNLHSLSLRKYTKRSSAPLTTIEQLPEYFDFPLLSKKVHCCVDNLNAMMARNYFPLDSQDGKGIYHRTNDKYRAIAIGVSGFADALMKMDLTFLHPLTRDFNKMVFACIYFNALCRSVDTAITEGPCEVHQGSPASQGLLQFDLWKEEYDRNGGNGVRFPEDDQPIPPSQWGQQPYELCNKEVIEPSWESLKQFIIKYGLYNSLVTAIMPTNNSAQICRNAEMIEPIHSGLYSRNTLSGNFTLLNRYMVQDLSKLNLWNDSTHNYLQNSRGSLKGFDSYVAGNPDKYPDFTGDSQRLTYLLEKYLTFAEVPQKTLIIYSADRGRYIDQGESHNVCFTQDKVENIISYMIYAASLGVKVLNYYFNVVGSEQLKLGIPSANKIETKKKNVVCTEEVCTMCST